MENIFSFQCELSVFTFQVLPRTKYICDTGLSFKEIKVQFLFPEMDLMQLFSSSYDKESLQHRGLFLVTQTAPTVKVWCEDKMTPENVSHRKSISIIWSFSKFGQFVQFRIKGWETFSGSWYNLPLLSFID